MAVVACERFEPIARRLAERFQCGIRHGTRLGIIVIELSDPAGILVALYLRLRFHQLRQPCDRLRVVLEIPQRLHPAGPFREGDRSRRDVRPMVIPAFAIECRGW
jgi:hypothetical protein